MKEIFASSCGDVEIDWDGSEATVRTTGTKSELIGNVTFREIEEADGSYYFKLTNMFLEGPNNKRAFLRAGIGRRCLQIASDEEGYPIMFSRDDGIRRKDGSRLTGDGPGFAEKMVEEGLAYWG